MRKMKGGSIASDSVTTMVNDQTYSQMNAAADNLTTAGMCGGAKKSKRVARAGSKGCNCGKPIKFGGSASIMDRVFDGFAANFSEQFVNRDQPFSSLPAPAVGGKAKKVKEVKKEAKRKPKAGAHKGGELKNMSEYMSSGVSDRYGKISVYNRKKGGASNVVGLDYNSGIKTNDFMGTNSNRNVSTAVLEVLSNASVTNASVASMNKSVEYGSYANASLKTPFSFGGVDGGAKKSKKSYVKVAAKKPKSKPSKAKK